MDNAQKAIMIGVGLFITIIIISAVLLIVNLGTGLVDDATDELGTMSTSLQNQILQSYDNKILSGVQVRSAIQQYMRSTDLTVVLCGLDDEDHVSGTAMVGKGNFNASAIFGKVEDEKKELGTIKFDEIEDVEQLEIGAEQYVEEAEDDEIKQTSMANFNDISKAGDTYINTSSNYRSLILRVAGTDTVVGIVFVPNAR